ncbi:GNAT family N-acetyltransferase [Streptococcus acidominimus]|uniref:GNAT family N-acetyltransferase n=1 Tax=Streptococcus acidominimus TaxID=1326 RepID=A0A4Y9FQL8_STRAI|nr:GNAT family N-acetyltransferase [Streptococcus acidominimus]MBF0818224.1 GNAT family N-acetyltransferase [Streptococcus acidominimus]MBF0838541.1 GNAT family N-acetyltransferase [Streptococcus acidominimus]MBF0848421.1 GNAT family N-acetyltransferase [Streptococcus danieliae]TFU31524.1 GNAT family N-acetyltransferase [Streptococcus acidominimus]
MEIRLAHPNEVTAICQIFEEARAFLAQSGSSQWQGSYSSQEDVFDDILSGRGYVAIVEGQVAAYTAVQVGNEPAYNEIYDGKWQHNNFLYTIFHRVAVAQKFRGQQIIQTFLQGLIEGEKGPDFRCDTHEQNLPMQHILEKLGFVYCGKVPIDGERLAYQKIKTKKEKSLYQEIAEDDRWLLGRND